MYLQTHYPISRHIDTFTVLLNSSSIQATPFPRCVQIWKKVKLWPKWPDPDTPIVSDCVRKCHICSFML